MRIRLTVLVAAVLAGACSTQPATPEQRAADQCRLFRNMMMTQEPQYVLEACTRHLGEAECRRCLNE